MKNEEIRADLTHSSLAIRGGQIRLPTDNVRLVMDAQLQPGILSVECMGRESAGCVNYGEKNRRGDIFYGKGRAPSATKDGKIKYRKRQHRCHWSDGTSTESQWRRNELTYILTVDEQLYQRVVQEMGDSYRLPCGMYYCCHEVEAGGGGHDHVGIGVAVAILMIIFLFLVICMLIWPMD